MKYSALISSILVIVPFFVSSGAAASVTAICVDGNHSSSYWKHDCFIWVLDHPDILGVTDVKVENHSFGTGYRNGSVINSVSGMSSGEDDISRRQSGGQTVMNANATAIYSATKLFAGQGMTWNPFSSTGHFFSKTLGTWVEDTSLIDTLSDTHTTE